MYCSNRRCPCGASCSCGPVCQCGTITTGAIRQGAKVSSGCKTGSCDTTTGSCGCKTGSCGGKTGAALRQRDYKASPKAANFRPTSSVKGTDLERLTSRKPPPPVPFRTARFQPSADPYAEHIRYALAKGLLSSMMLAQIGLEPMGYQPELPQFVETGRGTMIAGTNTSYPPRSAEPYNCRSEVIASLAYGLKYGMLSYRDIARIGLNPLAIRSCLP